MNQKEKRKEKKSSDYSNGSSKHVQTNEEANYLSRGRGTSYTNSALQFKTNMDLEKEEGKRGLRISIDMLVNKRLILKLNKQI